MLPRLTDEQKEANRLRRNEKKRIAAKIKRDAMNEEQRLERNRKALVRAKNKLANETPEEREERKRVARMKSKSAWQDPVKSQILRERSRLSKQRAREALAALPVNEINKFKRKQAEIKKARATKKPSKFKRMKPKVKAQTIMKEEKPKLYELTPERFAAMKAFLDNR
jgi:hypothetical protein